MSKFSFAFKTIALGSESVDYVDTNPERLAIAGHLGARPIKLDSSLKKLARSLQFNKCGYPIVVDASGVSGALEFSIQSLSVGGICTTVFFYLRRGTSVPLWRMYVNGNTKSTGLANVRTDLPEILRTIESG
jgi:threonine dehydrogenase-like Zn-dependent dehydrogenase